MRFFLFAVTGVLIGASTTTCYADTICLSDDEATCARHTSSKYTFRPWADADVKAAHEACTFVSRDGIARTDLTRTKVLSSGQDGDHRYRVLQVLCLRSAKPAM